MRLISIPTTDDASKGVDDIKTEGVMVSWDKHGMSLFIVHAVSGV